MFGSCVTILHENMVNYPGFASLVKSIKKYFVVKDNPSNFIVSEVSCISVRTVPSSDLEYSYKLVLTIIGKAKQKYYQADKTNFFWISILC